MTFSRNHAASKKKTVRGRKLPNKKAVWEMVLMPKFRPEITESVAKQVIIAMHQLVESAVSCSARSLFSQLRRSCLPRSAKHPSLRRYRDHTRWSRSQRCPEGPRTSPKSPCQNVLQE
ncbi:unnamed protein product [Polarella glacialis]|uniref:Uncharacterized protein n=1 Tax=Polarella glacialis TaxID=89957 RepID=A0A813EIZ7_POLGL|nr:unnamed protein product [Polarella glacialis]